MMDVCQHMFGLVSNVGPGVLHPRTPAEVILKIEAGEGFGC